MRVNPIVQALQDRCRRDGSAPLITWYQPELGARIELSGRTFANWVDKTTNLLAELSPSGPIAGEVTLTDPGHWMSLIWPLAAWQYGSGYLAGAPAADSELVVVGPTDAVARPGLETIACSLHPLGIGSSNLPDGVLDFSSEALAQPDQHWSAVVAEADPAWTELDQPAISHQTTGQLKSATGRRIVVPSTGWTTFVAALAAPLLGGGSSVVVSGAVSPTQLAQIAAAERATDPVA